MNLPICDIRLLLRAWICTALFLPPLQLNAEAAPNRSDRDRPEASAFQSSVHLTIDVGLETDGALAGHLLDTSGVAVTNASLRLACGQQSWRLTTEENGAFRQPYLQGGVYTIQYRGQTQLLRLWSSGTAPPSATPKLLLVENPDVIRGQCGMMCGDGCGCRPFSCWERLKYPLANPWIFGGIVATAIAIPVSIHNADQDEAAPVSP